MPRCFVFLAGIPRGKESLATPARRQKIVGNVRSLQRESGEWYRPRRSREEKRIGFCGREREDRALAERLKRRRKKGARAGLAGNKRLANPSCQFNLASNPGEMLIRTSLPHSARGAAHAATQRHFIFAQRYRREVAPRPCGNCVQSELRSPFLFSRLAADRSASPLLLLPRYPFRLSTLVIYRGYAG